jgi:hypothetical protein
MLNFTHEGLPLCTARLRLFSERGRWRCCFKPVGFSRLLVLFIVQLHFQYLLHCEVETQLAELCCILSCLTEIVLDGGSSLAGDASFRDTRSDVAGGDSPPSPATRRSRRHRSRGSATSSMDCTAGDATEKKDKSKKAIRKNRKKDKTSSAGDDGSSATCQDLPAVPKKSNRRKKQGSSEGSAATAGKDIVQAAEAHQPPVAED